MSEQEDMDYLRQCLEAAPFVPYPFDGEDMNLRAFRSKEELVAWYCQPPGMVNQPYRDRGFYCRELAMLSRLVQPRMVVEFGTSLGIGTCLLHWLNPGAQWLCTVDINHETFMPGDVRVPMGHLAKHQNIPAWYYTLSSSDMCFVDTEYNYDVVHKGDFAVVHRGVVDLCFIDADHSYEAVKKDSERAWLNKSTDRKWAIAWHDHNERHPGVLWAVAEFCAAKGVELQQRPDSDTVWIMGEK